MIISIYVKELEGKAPVNLIVLYHWLFTPNKSFAKLWSDNISKGLDSGMEANPTPATKITLSIKSYLIPYYKFKVSGHTTCI